MFLIGNLLVASGKVLNLLISIAYLLVIARVAASWLNFDTSSRVVYFLHATTEPFLSRIRKYLPVLPVDISPLIALIVLYFADTFVVESLLDMGYSLK